MFNRARHHGAENGESPETIESHIRMFDKYLQDRCHRQGRKTEYACRDEFAFRTRFFHFDWTRC